MSPFLQHITSLWILHFSVYSEMEIACHVREYSDGCSPFMLECKFLTKRWFVRTPAVYFKLTSMCFVRLDTTWDSIEYSPFEKGSAVR
jgi:hypothetical protein